MFFFRFGFSLHFLSPQPDLGDIFGTCDAGAQFGVVYRRIEDGTYGEYAGPIVELSVSFVVTYIAGAHLGRHFFKSKPHNAGGIEFLPAYRLGLFGPTRGEAIE